MTPVQELYGTRHHSSAAGPPVAAPLRRRKKLVLLVAVLCALSSGVGAAASRLILSPAERAARTAPPPATVLTAKVQLRVLTATLTVRGEVTPQAVASVGAAGRPTPVVTLLPVEIGDQLHEGQIIAEISGQPVVSLGGVLPAYRDLRAGDRGRDVRQLQQALRRLGYLKNEPLTGNLDSATADAVGRLFAHDGYPDGAGVPGVVLPLSGVAYLPAFPARVLNVTAAVGQVAPDALLSIACGRLTISSSVAPDQAEFVRQDMAADVLAEGIGKQATGTVAEVGSLVTPNAGDAQTGSAAGTGPFVPFTIVTRAVLGSDWSGQDVRVTLTQAKTSTPVLIVPASAITAGADGRTTVTVQRGSTTEIVPVTAGGTGDGFVQIDAAGRLRAGDNVVIGS